MPRVSVLIPAYNAERHICRAIESVLRQDYRDMEIIVVNDGSTDATEAVMDRYIPDKKIRYLAIANRGVSGALNAAFAGSSGEYIAILHADDIYMPSKLGIQVSSMDRHRQYAVSYTAESYFLEGTGLKVESPNYHLGGDIFYFLKRNNFIHASSVMLKRDLMDKFKFDETLACHEDWDLFLKISATGAKFLYIDKMLTEVSIREDQLSADNGVMRKTRQEAGNRAKRLWSDFKRSINVYSLSGIRALVRYAAFKSKAALNGFPDRAIFNKPAPQEELAALADGRSK